MRAIVVEEFGGPEVLRVVEVPDPAAGEDEVLVDVAAADVIFLDTAIRAGHSPFPVSLPYVPGIAVAGTAGGRRVAGPTGTNTGGYAERAVLPAARVVDVPDDVDLPTAAALITDGPTALRLVEVTRIGAGDRVLVLGAAGGAALLTVQLAAAAGAHVVGAARGAAKLDLVVRTGADAVVDYSEPDWAQNAREALGGAADVVLDGVGGALGATAFALTTAGSRFSAHGTPSGSFAPIEDPGDVVVTGIGAVQFGPDEHTALVRRALAAGLTVPLGPARSLAEAPEAHRALERREAVGKTVLTVG